MTRRPSPDPARAGSHDGNARTSLLTGRAAGDPSSAVRSLFDRPIRVLVACEFSGAVRDAFAALGHDAMSCDIQPSETPGAHHQGHVFEVLDDGWDLLIAHPPCTYLCNSGVRWLATEPGRREKMEAACAFFRALLDAPVPHVAVENPIMHGHAKRLIGRQQAQIVHPWEHGHGEQKQTCLWLRGLPPLMPTDVVDGREQRLWRLSPGADRSNERSKTFPGIAAAMADQWGAFVANQKFMEAAQ